MDAGDADCGFGPSRVARNTVSDHGKLIEGLVGERWQWLYDSNPQFHNDVHSLALLLPAWIDALAVRGEAGDRQIAQELSRLQNEPRTLGPHADR